MTPQGPEPHATSRERAGDDPRRTTPAAPCSTTCLAGLIATSTDRRRPARRRPRRGRYALLRVLTRPRRALHFGNPCRSSRCAGSSSPATGPSARWAARPASSATPKESGERTLNPVDLVGGLGRAIRAQLERFFEFEAPTPPDGQQLRLDAGPSTLDFLTRRRQTLQRQPDARPRGRRGPAGRQRHLHTEFSYQLLQSYGLPATAPGSTAARCRPVAPTSGATSSRGRPGTPRHGRPRARRPTTPLVTKTDGTKFGKTEGGTIWLDPELTSPRGLVPVLAQRRGRPRARRCCGFSFRTHEEIEALEEADAQRPHTRRTVPAALAAGRTRARAGSAPRAAAKALGQGDVRRDAPPPSEAALRPEGRTPTSPRGVDSAHRRRRAGAQRSRGLRGAGRRTIAEGGATSATGLRRPSRRPSLGSAPAPRTLDPAPAWASHRRHRSWVARPDRALIRRASRAAEPRGASVSRAALGRRRRDPPDLTCGPRVALMSSSSARQGERTPPFGGGPEPNPQPGTCPDGRAPLHPASAGSEQGKHGHDHRFDPVNAPIS